MEDKASNEKKYNEKLNYVQGTLLMNAWNYGSCTHFQCFH